MAISRDSGYTTSPGSTWAGSNYVPVLYAKKALVKWYKSTMYNETCNLD